MAVANKPEEDSMNDTDILNLDNNHPSQLRSRRIRMGWSQAEVAHAAASHPEDIAFAEVCYGPRSLFRGPRLPHEIIDAVLHARWIRAIEGLERAGS
jgi:hypothetical protein